MAITKINLSSVIISKTTKDKDTATINDYKLVCKNAYTGGFNLQKINQKDMLLFSNYSEIVEITKNTGKFSLTSIGVYSAHTDLPEGSYAILYKNGEKQNVTIPSVSANSEITVNLNAIDVDKIELRFGKSVAAIFDIVFSSTETHQSSSSSSTVESTNVLDLSNVQLIKTVKDNDTAKISSYNILCKNTYTGGLSIQTFNNKKMLTTSVYKEILELTKSDKSKFSLQSFSIYASYGITVPTGGVVTVYKDGGNQDFVIPQIEANNEAVINVNLKDVSKIEIKFSKCSPAIYNIIEITDVTVISSSSSSSSQPVPAPSSSSSSSSSSQPVPAPSPSSSSSSIPSTRKAILGFIIENSLPNWKNIEMMKKAAGNRKFGARIWQTIDGDLEQFKKWWSTDPLNNIKNAKEILELKAECLLTMNPEEGAAYNIPTDPKIIRAKGQKVCNQLIDPKGLNVPTTMKLQFINEANWGGYWKNRDWKSAFDFAAIWAQPFREAGFKFASPSLTTNDPGLVKQVIDYMILKNYNKSFDAMDWHFYNTWGIDESLIQMRKFADDNGIEIWLTECGPAQSWPNSPRTRNDYANDIKVIIPKLEKYADYWAYWLLNDMDKFPNHSYLFTKEGNDTELLKVYQSIVSKTS